MDKNLNLNTDALGGLPDHTTKSQRPVAPEGTGCSAQDLKRGYKLHPVDRIPIFDPDTTGENVVGDPYTYGGFLGRPPGTSR